MQVVVNDTLIAYSDRGSGSVLLCVHGWMDSKSAYQSLADELINEYRVIALDLPNFGVSQTTEKVETIANYAQFLSAFLDKLHITQYILIGHSMGCQIAIQGVGSGILSPRKLILLAPAGVRNKKNMQKKLLRYLSVMVRPFVPKSIKKQFYARIGSDYDPDLSMLHKNIIKNSLTTDVQAEATKIGIPTLVVNGTEDHSTPLWMAETLNHLIPGSTLEIVTGADHWIQQKHPALIADMVRIFAE